VYTVKRPRYLCVWPTALAEKDMIYLRLFTIVF
jgi:hypothetical protein